jgi:hypothetical protein
VEGGRLSDARAEAELIDELARDIEAENRGVALRGRGSSLAYLAAHGSPEATAQVANQVLRLVPQLYAGSGDPCRHG